LPPALTETDQLIQGVFEPPSGFAATAIARNKLVICLFAVVFALAGTAFGLSRPRVYTASATLQIGQVNPNSPSFYGYVQSAAALAAAFSRAVESQPVLATVQHDLKLAPAVAAARLSAEPIPQSPALRVIATGPTSPAAIQLANVAANAVIAYESQSNSANPEAGSLLHEYRDAAVRLQHVATTFAHLNRRRGVSGDALASAEAEKVAAEVKLKAIALAYTQAVSSQAPRTGLVSLLAGAVTAGSDRNSKVQLYGFIGLLAGVVCGCLVAIVRERRRIAGRFAMTTQAQV
jgi:uncharacterized protein involved in exopolysaccharide biosynthesis